MTLIIEGLRFAYPGSRKDVLDGLTLTVDEGEICSLLGRSGSGKTTTLDLIAGFMRPSAGRIVLNGRDITHLRPQDRNVGVVFQEYALFPHMTVRGNIEFGPRGKGLPSRKVSDIADDMLSLAGLTHLSERMPSQLSGGERQRVALARALAAMPDLILLDEPLSALDVTLREVLRKDLRRILKERGIKAVYVTHDQMEALAISDRIGLLHDGRLIEEGAPEEIYWRPRTTVAARFMGMGNIIKVLERRDGSLLTSFGDIPWKGKAPSFVGFRPESVRGRGPGLRIGGRVLSVEYRGKDLLVEVIAGKKTFRLLFPSSSRIGVGSDIVFFAPYHSLVPLEREHRPVTS